jgi:hypothetical protein
MFQQNRTVKDCCDCCYFVLVRSARRHDKETLRTEESVRGCQGCIAIIRVRTYSEKVTNIEIQATARVRFIRKRIRQCELQHHSETEVSVLWLCRSRRRFQSRSCASVAKPAIEPSSRKRNWEGGKIQRLVGAGLLLCFEERGSGRNLTFILCARGGGDNQ